MSLTKIRTSLLLALAASSLMPFNTAGAAAPAIPSYCEKDTYPGPDVAAVFDAFMDGIAKVDAASVNDALTVHHVDPNAQYLTDGFCYMPLVLAIERYKNSPAYAAQGNLQVVDLLLDHDANPNIFNYEGLTPLQYAIKMRSPELAQALLAHGADVDAVSHGDSATTALQQALAVIPFDPTMVTLLLKAGASARGINLVDASRFNPATTLEVVKLLIAHGADVNAQWHGFYTELNLVAELGDVDLTRLLLENGAAVNIPRHGGANETSLHTAAIQFEKLNRAGSPQASNPPDLLHTKHFKRPVPAGPGGGDQYATIVALLIAHGADVNARDLLKKTPLHDSVDSDDPQVVNMLIAAGADVNAIDTYGRSPLDYTTTVPVATLLLAHGAKFDSAGRSALRDVAWNKRAELAAFFIANGADVNAADDDGTTALHIAAYNGNKEIAGILLSGGAKVDALSHFAGMNGTPLQVALQHGHMDVAKLLVDHGADYKGVIGGMSESDIEYLLGPQRAADYEQSKKDKGKPPID